MCCIPSSCNLQTQRMRHTPSVTATTPAPGPNAAPVTLPVTSLVTQVTTGCISDLANGAPPQQQQQQQREQATPVRGVLPHVSLASASGDADKHRVTQ
jgi:hypothetical protein